MTHVEAYYQTDQVNGNEYIRTTCAVVSEIWRGERMVYHWSSDVVDFIYTLYGWARVPF